MSRSLLHSVNQEEHFDINQFRIAETFQKPPRKLTITTGQNGKKTVHRIRTAEPFGMRPS